MNTAAEHLVNLIRVPSVSAMTNRPVVEYAERVLHAAGWQSCRQTYKDDAGVEKVNLIAAPAGQDIVDPHVELAFVCHTDTVPYATGWAGAVNPAEVNGGIHGCGACDVKGVLACLLTAAESTSAGETGNVRIVLTADEEIGCIGAKHLLAADLLRPAAMVIGEPTSLHPARAGKGYCLARITVFGREAHSALPEQGVSAIYAAAHLIVALEQIAMDLTFERNEFFSPSCTTLNVGTIQGGTAKNIIPGECSLLVEWRPIPGAAVASVPQKIQAAINKERRTHPAIEYVFTVLREQPGFETPAESGLIRSLEKISGRHAVSIPFGSEASVFAAVCQELVVFGPGNMESAHSDRECIAIDDLTQAVACIQSIMRQHRTAT